MESDVSVRDVLTRTYVGVSESDTVLDAVELMRGERVGCVLVVRGSDPVGIMTEWDVLGLVAEEGAPRETAVGDVMSAPLVSVDADTSVAQAADVMTRDRIRNLVVESDGEVVGVLTQRDVIAATGSFHGGRSTAVAGEEGYARNPVDPGGAAVENETGTDITTEADALPNGGDEYSQQGVCEGCGSLTDSLWESNGQLLCADCRSV